MIASRSSALLLFGATGDLARRMLLPSLFGLHEDGLLNPGLRIVGTARSDLDDAGFREMARTALGEFLPDERKDDTKLEGFLDRLAYQPLDASNLAGFPALADKVGDTSGGLAIFLSTAPFLFEPTIAGLAAAGLAHEGVRIEVAS
jgi:glucose-6-phosphate 1-dehydrogenase